MAALVKEANAEARSLKIPLKANTDEALKKCPGVKSVIVVKRTGGGHFGIQVDGEEKPLREALLSDYACTGLTKILLKKYNAFAQSSELEALLAPDGKEKLQDYLWGRELLDALEDFPAEGLSAEEFVGLLRAVPPRLYSIASSIKAHPDEVHLTVALVRDGLQGGEDAVGDGNHL